MCNFNCHGGCRAKGKDAPIPDDGQFRLVEITHCSPAAAKTEALNSFLGGKLAGVRYSSFLTPDQACEHAQAAHNFGFDRYASAPEVGIIGTSLVDAIVLNTYFALTEMLARPRNAFANSASLMNLVVTFLTAAIGQKVKVFSVNGRRFHAGNWRLLTGGAGIHLDLISDDCPELKDLCVKFQGSFVLHIEAPILGGETTIYNRKGSEEAKRDPLYIESGWKYTSAVVEGAEKIVVPAVTGDLVLLPTQLYHSVAPSAEPGRERISFSAFLMKLKDDETIYLYS